VTDRYLPVASLCLIWACLLPAQAATAYFTELLSLRADSDFTIAATGNALTTDLLNGEDIAAPGEGDTVRIGSTNYVWTRAYDSSGVWADDAGEEDFVAYWSVSALCSEEQDVRIKFRHDDGLRIWVFGSLIVDESAPDSGVEGTSKPVHLRNGSTRFLFKLHQRSGNAHFAAGLVDTSGGTLEKGAVIPIFTAGGLSSEGVIRLLSPEEGDVYRAGDTLTIRWVVEPRRLRAGVAPYLSLDNGLSWIGIGGKSQINYGDEQYYSGDTGTFKWDTEEQLVDDFGDSVKVVSNACRVRVYSQYDPDLPTAVSDPFRIIGDSSSVRFGSPASQARALDVVRLGSGDLAVRVNVSYAWRLAVLDAGGRTVASHAGNGRTYLVLHGGQIAAGVHVLDLWVDGRTSRARILFR
jgi:hypothetical protein